ncbi:putative corA-like Mg2+ transporter protein [Lyophyllum shimeji]|uniref:CorA-like Mg2+ transporter protein n=1 Tax=Lyophyllum shimeji TaxID=47721 RepID=A0A9P3UMA3_LYOSH|nr:putative corA-like Mg2+ transporter protein [Lyophyllum shimeji]
MNDSRPALRVDVDVHDVHDDQSDDIYRGPPIGSSIRAPSISTVDSSSSSSSSFLAGGRGRLGAIAAVVELAISRWARGNASDTSSSSSSSRSSIVTLSRSQRARVRRRRSAATIHSLQSERDIAAHISRLKAREESRQIPRQFTLYLPPYLSPHAKAAQRDATRPRVTSTASLSLLLPQLDAALKKATRVRRNQDRQRIPKSHAKRRMEHHDYMLSDTAVSSPTPPPAKPRAWYLDVASPSWEDMRTLGKCLHLHPLTLEDILQREPREKLELFPKLGYYFISFRAIETQTMNHRKPGAREGAAALDTPGQDEASVGEANVYLVVFNDGICSFHFTDISEHTDRVRNRIMLLEEVINMTSDWIAHGILDSIVDSFFPVLEEIGREVAAIEDLALTAGGGVPQPGATQLAVPSARAPAEGKTSMPSIDIVENEKHFSAEKHGVTPSTDHVKPRFSSPQLTFPLALRRLRRFASKKWRSFAVMNELHPPRATHTTLRRMAKTRKLVTSLTRLLATKSEVVMQIKKRLLTSAHASLPNGSNSDDDRDVATYLGDVHDHLLTLQHSLAHYDRILSQSHPTYLSHLRSGVAVSKNGTDKAILYLTSVSMAVVCIQTIVGVFSLNVNVPKNQRVPSGRYNVFGIVFALCVCVLCAYIYVVRRWWNQAKAKRRHRPVL